MRVPVPRSAYLSFLLASALVVPAGAQMVLSSSTTFAGPGSALAYGLARNQSTGDLYVAGASSSAGNSDIWLGRYSSNLVFLSSVSLDGSGGGYDIAYNAVVAPDGTVYAVGAASVASFGAASWLGRFSAAGALISSATYAAPSPFPINLLRGVTFTPAGELFTAGNVGITSTTGRILLAKHDPATLAMISSVTFTNDATTPESEVLVADSSGFLYIGGSSPPNSAASNDLWIAKYDTSLVFQSSAVHAGPAGNSDMARSILVHPNGSIYVTGIMNNAGITNDLWVGRYSSGLVLQSSFSINGSANNRDEGNGLALGNGGNILVSGSVSQTGASDDIFYGEYTAGLALVSRRTLSSGGSAVDFGYAVVSDTAGGAAYVAGAYGASAWLAKFSVTPATPTAPGGFAGTALSSTSILWSWLDNSSNEDGFRVMNAGSNVSGDLPAGTTTWTQTGLSANVSTGTLSAQAFNAGGAANSGTASRYTLAASPGGFASSNVSLFRATVSWSATGNSASTVYQLERSTGTGYGLRQASSGTLSFADSGLTPGATYLYQVRALNGDGVASAYAGPLSVSPLPYPVLVSLAVTPSALSVPVSSAAQFTAVGTFNDGSTRALNGVWAPRAPLLEARTDAAGAFSGGKLYVFGGSAVTGLPQGSFSAEAYDVAADSWSWRTASPVRRGGAFAAEHAGKIYVAGGCTNGDCTSALTTAVYEYDTVADAWTARAALPVARFDAAFETISGKLYAAGGLMSGYVSTTSVLMYDPGANTWTARASMPLARALAAAGVINGKLYVAGGYSSATFHSELQIYDPVADSWTLGAPMPSGRYGTGGAVVDGRLYVVGGQQGVALATESARVQIYDPVSNSWSDGPFLQVPRYGPVVDAYQGNIYAAGSGFNNTGSAALEVLTPDAGTWSSDLPAVGTVTAAGAATGLSPGIAQITVTTGALNVSAALTVLGAPAAPTGFAGTAVSTSSIYWTWTDNASNEAGYRIKNGVSSPSGDLPANTTAWTFNGLLPATSVTILVQAFNSSSTANSATVSRYTLAEVPGTPSFSGVYQTSGTVSWSAAGNPAAVVYQLERSTGTGYGLQFAGAATYYFDQYLTPGATHTYRVLALNGDSVAGAYSATNSVVAVIAPPAPGAAGTPAGTALGVSSVSWTWVLASGATNHHLYRASDNSFLGSSASGPFVQTALSPNVPYGLRAAGVNVGGTGPLSPSATVYTLATAPSAVASTAVGYSSLTVTWSLNGSAAGTTAQVERSADAVTYSTKASGALTSYADADLLGCTTYHYRVRHVNGDGFATAYATHAAVTANTVPAPPAGLTAAANAGGTVGLTWGASPTEGVTGYRLFWDSGSGTVSYAAPIAALSSGTLSWTSGVLASSASYTFALRTAHRCGLVETAGALAMSGAAAAVPALRAAIKEPDSGKRLHGNRVTILGELIYGTPADAQQVLFQFKTAAATSWTNVPAANANHSNPDLSFPYFTHWNVDLLAPGDYDLRAVAYDRNGVPDAAPPAVRVAVVAAAVNADIDENAAGATITKNQTIANGVSSVVDAAGAGANDPSVRVTIPAGAVTAATATVTVVANPAITTAAPRGFNLVGSAIRIGLSNGQTALNGAATISLTYPETIVFPSLLQIYYLDEATGQWSRDFASTVDTASRTVTGATPHFSTFALLLGTAFAPNLDSVRVYPVPFKPNGPNADEGRPFSSGDPNSGIIFANLAAGSEIRIYTLGGRLVAALDNAPITGVVRWDARNQDGRDAASGAYFAVIKAAGQKTVVKKLVIIR